MIRGGSADAYARTLASLALTPERTSANGWSPLAVGVDAIVLTPPVGFTVLTEGFHIAFEAAGANTGPVTVNIDGTAYPAVHPGGSALVAGDIPSAGTLVEGYFSLDHGHFHLQTIRHPATIVSPKLSGAAAVGTSTRYARQDHQHGSAIVGVTDGSSALAGDLGELIQSIIPSGSALALTTTVPRDITSINLSAGNWAVSGNVAMATDAAANLTREGGNLSIASGSVNSGYGWTNRHAAYIPGANVAAFYGPCNELRVSVAVPTTIYLVGIATFSAGTVSAYGHLHARRVP